MMAKERCWLIRGSVSDRLRDRSAHHDSRDSVEVAPARGRRSACCGIELEGRSPPPKTPRGTSCSTSAGCGSPRAPR